VRPLHDEERGWLKQQLIRLWGTAELVSRGHIHEAAKLPAFVCEGDEPVGVVTYDIRDRQCELVTLNAFEDGRGVGSALLAAVAKEATARGCRRLWLITTNDNLRALAFYQRRGLRLAALYPGAVDESRRIKPSISLVAENGIPIRDELELELVLAGGRA
jgi:GNAT superfamily N-acetyltransferase